MEAALTKNNRPRLMGRRGRNREDLPSETRFEFFSQGKSMRAMAARPLSRAWARTHRHTSSEAANDFANGIVSAQSAGEKV